MVQRIVTHDDVTGACELAELTPYPAVTSADGSVTVVATVDGVTGQTTFDLAADVDINVANFTYNPATQEITITETDNTTHTIDVSDLVDTNTTSVVTNLVAGNRIATHDDGNGTVVDINETVTSIADNNDASFTYTDEAGADTIITLCQLIDDLAIAAAPIGG